MSISTGDAGEGTAPADIALVPSAYRPLPFWSLPMGGRVLNHVAGGHSSPSCPLSTIGGINLSNIVSGVFRLGILITSGGSGGNNLSSIVSGVFRLGAGGTEVFCCAVCVFPCHDGDDDDAGPFGMASDIGACGHCAGVLELVHMANAVVLLLVMWFSLLMLYLQALVVEVDLRH